MYLALSEPLKDMIDDKKMLNLELLEELFGNIH
jgi:hypothetical protein